jgi:hypothetical protein
MLDNAKETLARTTADVLLTRFTPGQRVTHDGHHGTVESVGRFYVSIRCDVSGKLRRISPENIEEMNI